MRPMGFAVFQATTPAVVEASWNVIAHAQKPVSSFGETDSPFKSAGASVQSTTGSRDVRISGSNAGYTMIRGSVQGTGYPLHSPVSLFCSYTFALWSHSFCVSGCLLLNIVGDYHASQRGRNVWVRPDSYEPVISYKEVVCVLLPVSFVLLEVLQFS